MAHDYYPAGTRRTLWVIPVEGWDRSYPYKVKQRSGFRSFKQIFLNMEESAGILISQDYVLLERSDQLCM